jgi:hypothetical protein
MHPAIVHVCDRPPIGEVIEERSERTNCREMAYTRNDIEVRLATLLQRKGYASSINLNGSMLHVGLGAWLGPDGGGFDLLKFGATLRRILPESWDAPFHFGFTSVVLDNLTGKTQFGVFAPGIEWSFLIGVRHFTIGPGAGFQYRWRFDAPDDIQLTFGLTVNYTNIERVWRFGEREVDINHRGVLVR